MERIGDVAAGQEECRAEAACPDGNVASMPQRVREACHDLRQPIATINALVSAALGESQLTPEIAAWLELIQGQARYLDSIVLDALGRTGAPMPVDLAAVVEEAIGTRTLTTQSLVDSDLTPAVVLSTEAEICRLVDNLVGNAERATGGHGQIRVTVAPDAGECVLTVEDDGPGFGAAMPSGWKLGLQVVQRLVGALGGRVEIGNSSLGGARVSVLIPELASGGRVS